MYIYIFILLSFLPICALWSCKKNLGDSIIYKITSFNRAAKRHSLSISPCLALHSLLMPCHGR